jgi:Temperature dependent protein affecting M2 dsRNA replication
VIDIRLPFGKEVNTALAILMRCKLEESMSKNRSEGHSIEKELYLVDVESSKNLVPDDTAEVARMYALWDAVPTLSPMNFPDFSLYWP